MADVQYSSCMLEAGNTATTLSLRCSPLIQGYFWKRSLKKKKALHQDEHFSTEPKIISLPFKHLKMHFRSPFIQACWCKQEADGILCAWFLSYRKHYEWFLLLLTLHVLFYFCFDYRYQGNRIFFCNRTNMRGSFVSLFHHCIIIAFVSF